MIDNTIGDNIRQSRLLKGWSQSKLGEEAGGRSVNQINGYECGRSRPSGPILNIIATALGVSVESLLGTEKVSALPLNVESKFAEIKRHIAEILGVATINLKITFEIMET